ncbi:hypothetical protein HN873_020336 [Arachis hypogaea]
MIKLFLHIKRKNKNETLTQSSKQPFPLPPFSIPIVSRQFNPFLRRHSLAWHRVRRRRGSFATASPVLRIRGY